MDIQEFVMRLSVAYQLIAKYHNPSFFSMYQIVFSFY